MPGLLRARVGLRPRVAEDEGGQGRRRVGRHRPEGVDHLRARGQVVHARRAHRHRRAQAQGPHLLPDGHGAGRRAGPAAASRSPASPSSTSSSSRRRGSRTRTSSAGSATAGWSRITTLMHERAGIAFALAGRGQDRDSARLMELARERGLDEDPVTRQRLAQLYIESEAIRLNASRGLTQIMKTGHPGPEGSLTKWQWSDVNQALTELAMDMLRPRGADHRRRLDLPLPARPGQLDRGRDHRDPEEHRRRARARAAEAAMNFDFTDDQRAIKSHRARTSWRAASSREGARARRGRRVRRRRSGTRCASSAGRASSSTRSYGGQELGVRRARDPAGGARLRRSRRRRSSRTPRRACCPARRQRRAEGAAGCRAIASGEARGHGRRDRRTARAPLVPDAELAASIVLVDGDRAAWLRRRLGRATSRRWTTIDSTRRSRASRPTAARRCAGDVPAGLDRVAIALSAELVGLAQRTMEMAVEYAKDRKQFDRPIGAYQARLPPLRADAAGDRGRAVADATTPPGRPTTSRSRCRWPSSMAKAYASDAGCRVPAPVAPGARRDRLHLGARPALLPEARARPTGTCSAPRASTASASPSSAWRARRAPA